MKLRNKQFVSAIASAILALSLSMPADAGVQEKMNEIFGEMSNVTNPGSFHTQRRGVLNGGSFISRGKIVDTSLINITLPHASGGCGGIDAFAGSISFINADQFVELLRSIASNAKGYAFSIAMNAASSLISSVLGDYQKVIQAMNNLNINSCELAQGIVNTGLDAMGLSALGNGYKLESALSGFADVAESFRNIGPTKNPVTDVSAKADSDPNLKKKIENLYGNVVWKELKRNNTKAVLGTDTEDKEYGTLMAMTGTIIVDKPEENQSSAQTEDIPIRTFDHLITAKDYIEGGKVYIYTCGSDTTDCLTIKKSDNAIQLVGLKDKILDAIKGNGTTTGLIYKYRSGTALSDAETKIMHGLPGSAGAIVSNLSMFDAQTASAMAENIAYAVAMYYAFDMSKEYLRFVKYNVTNSKMAKGKQEMIDTLNKRIAQIELEYLSYSQEHEPLSAILSHYNDIQKNITKLSMAVKNRLPTQAENSLN